MNEYRAFCPKCRLETMFVRSAQISTCQTCGFQAESGERPPVIEAPGARPGADGVLGVLRVLARVAVIMVAIGIVGLAVLFAGCLVIMK